MMRDLLVDLLAFLALTVGMAFAVGFVGCNAEGDPVLPALKGQPPLKSTFFIGGAGGKHLYIVTVAKIENGRCKLTATNKGKVTFTLILDKKVKVAPGKSAVIYSHPIGKKGVVSFQEDAGVVVSGRGYVGVFTFSTYYPADGPE